MTTAELTRHLLSGHDAKILARQALISGRIYTNVIIYLADGQLHTEPFEHETPRTLYQSRPIRIESDPRGNVTIEYQNQQI